VWCARVTTLIVGLSPLPLLHPFFRFFASAPAPKSAVELFTTSKQTIDRIDVLLDSYHDSGVAAVLNAEGYRTPRGKTFSNATVGNIRRTYGLKSFYDRLREWNTFTINEIAHKLDVSLGTAFVWAKIGMRGGAGRRIACFIDYLPET
jgi:hypothetical protein